MKGYAVDHADKVVMKTGQLIETSFISFFKDCFNKKKKKSKENDKNA